MNDGSSALPCRAPFSAPPGTRGVHLTIRTISSAGVETVTPYNGSLYDLFFRSGDIPEEKITPRQVGENPLYHWVSTFKSSSQSGRLLYRGPGDVDE